MVSSLLFVAGSVLTYGVVISRGQVSTTTQVNTSQPSSFRPAGGCAFSYLCTWAAAIGGAFGGLEWNTCTIDGYWTYGGACTGFNKLAGQINFENAGVAANNTVISLYDFLNITASGTANLNATMQELLSYFENRAEALVPDLLNVTGWNNTLYDFIAVESGLVPALEGYETAFGQQEYQDWNATAQTWDNAFGSSGQFSGTAASFNFNMPNDIGAHGAVVGTPVVSNGHNLNVSQPWEFWYLGQTYPTITLPTNGAFLLFNMEPGGTIVDANWPNAPAWVYPSYTVTDLTSGASFSVPNVSFSAWENNTSIPVESTLQHIGQFDLLKLTCTANCTGDGSLPAVEATGAYAFVNVTGNPLGRLPFNSMAYSVRLSGYSAGASGFTSVGVPYYTGPVSPINDTDGTVCVSLHPAPLGSGGCTTIETVPTGGTSRALGTGPGSVPGGPYTLLSYGPTAQGLVNNTMTMAYDYWLTLRTLTDYGKYAIPPYCSIPPPSAAFPAATDYAVYGLSTANIELAYLSYLDSVARSFSGAFTEGLEFCGEKTLALSYNWSTVWRPTLNISVSEYFGTPSGPVYINGTPDPTSRLTFTTTWPVQNVQPALLYPFEYQMDVLTNTVYPIPQDDPLVSLLLNYPGNEYYGITGTAGADWGLPSYSTLNGFGSLVWPSGNLSNQWGGTNNGTGDAIDITSCTYRNSPQNPCDLAVTYYNNFTVGLVYGLQSPIGIPTGGGGGGGGLGSVSGCGFGVLNQWYDSWAGYVGSAVGNAFGYFGAAVKGVPVIGGGLAFIIDGIGCILAWIVVILLFVLFIYVAVRVVAGVVGGARKSYKENVN